MNCDKLIDERRGNELSFLGLRSRPQEVRLLEYCELPGIYKTHESTAASRSTGTVPFHRFSLLCAVPKSRRDTQYASWLRCSQNIAYRMSGDSQSLRIRDAKPVDFDGPVYFSQKRTNTGKSYVLDILSAAL